MGVKMKLRTFQGGIHPFDGKELSKNKPITNLSPKGEMVFPLSQHIGAPAVTLVKPGDSVLVGQKIAEAQGFISACIISSVSGTVKAIEPRLTTSGAMAESIIIENDNEYKKIAGFGVERDYTKLSKDEIRTIIKNAGIVGMGGAAFPTHVKLTPKDENGITHVIVNAAECEPYLTSDYRIMLEEPANLITGLKIILSLFDNAKGVIAIENNKPDCIETLDKLLTPEDKNKICVMPLKAKYPQGAERNLIYAVTGKKINSKMLPADAGVIVNNVDTVISVKNAICNNIPLIRRIITVTGDAVVNPQNFCVPTGTCYQELIDAAGGFKSTPEKIISGGPMMGTSLYSTNVPVTKNSSAILALTKDEVAEKPETPCIRCGRCVSVCPSRLIPQRLQEYSNRFDNEAFENNYGMECYECGSCTFVCPAGRKLTQSFKETRKSIIAQRKKK